MQTILGANGIIGIHTARALTNYTSRIRLVSRNPQKVNASDELVSADLTNERQTFEAVKGSEVAYLTIGLPYSLSSWETQWPIVMANVINACKEHQTKLVFLDNVYAYGRTTSWMTEETPFNPCSKKGEIRAKIAQQLLDEMHTGSISGIIARSADFYGPNTENSFLNKMVFEKYAQHKSALWMINENLKHSFTYTPDAGSALALLGNSHQAFGQTWHLPTHKDVLTGKEMIELIATAFACAPNYSVLKKWMLQMVSWFNPIVHENMEMLYQNEGDYLFSSAKFEKAFSFEPSSYKRGVVDTVASLL
ncbi:MAG: NAD-dependent dehydratase [Bacteroidetes bacterium B1(2017)]|nr:MAG: NAD-dependent dehydratase [Bacteroidetes bacterium B1(2017)]